MNKIYFFTLLVFFSFNLVGQVDSDILMTVGNENVTVGEFRYIYEKNNGDKASYSKASLDEYLDLYKKFKLKVAKAKDMKLDTIKALQDELAGYRQQLANSYLMDKEVMNSLYRELYDRMDKDIRISHILVSVPKNANEEQIAQSKEKIDNIYNRLKAGEEFEKLAMQVSNDKISAPNGGDIGFYTAMMPSGFYELENVMYSTPVGKYSNPVKSKIGFHIIKVTEERPAKGQTEVAQILIRKQKENEADDSKARIDKVYEKLKAGEDFKDLVAEFSEDKQTKSKGGAFPVFGINQFDKEFEDKAFSLKNVGDITEPFETNVGWHILTKLSDIKKDPFEIFKRKMEPTVKKDERYEIAKATLIAEIKETSNFAINTTAVNEFVKAQDDEFYTFKWRPAQGDYLKKDVINMGKDYKVSMSEFAEFCRKNTRSRLAYDKSTKKEEVVDRLLKEFSDAQAMVYEQANLEEKYPDFKSLMREYEEGILLFEATKISVWDKANQDTIGLYEYYENNKNNYVWEERAKLSQYIIHSNDEKLAEKIRDYAKDHSPEDVLKKFNKKEEVIELMSKNIDLSSNELTGLERVKGAISNVVNDNKSNLQMVRKIEEVIPGKRKTMQEARGYIVADYQSYLETVWVAKLKRDFPIQINENVYNKLIK